MDFASQFFSQVWGLIVFIIGMFAAYIALWAYLRMRRKRIQAEKRAAIMGDTTDYSDEKAKNEKSKDKSIPGWLSPAKSEVNLIDDGDDPLAELYAVRAEEAQEELAKPRPPLQKAAPVVPATPRASVVSPKPAPNVEEEDDVVDLASLLAGMGAEEKDYHHIATSAVLVKREDGAKTSAKELLSIQRDESDKRLLVQIGEIGYRSLLNNAAAKNSFTQTMKELSGVILSEDTPPTAPENPQGESHRIAKDTLNIRLENGREAVIRELFSILRDESDGHLMIQIGDVAYRSLQQNEQAKTAFTKIMKELSTVVLKPDDAPAPTYVPDSAPEIDTKAQNDLLGVDESANLPPGVLRVKKMDELEPGFRVGRFGQVKVDKVEKAPELNFAEAIEAFLQYKITQQAEFQKRGIHVRPTPAGGVRIEADGKTYDFVDDVADPDIRAFIKQAIAEWQDHH